MLLLVLVFAGCVLALLWTAWAMRRSIRKHSLERRGLRLREREEPGGTDEQE